MKYLISYQFRYVFENDGRRTIDSPQNTMIATSLPPIEWLSSTKKELLNDFNDGRKTPFGIDVITIYSVIEVPE